MYKPESNLNNILSKRVIKIRKHLLQWSQSNPRDLPWKHTKDPYRIWVSEIILQQTRVAQGIAYYHQFLQAFPSIGHLAQADIDQVMKVWEGLGYYRRAKHMHDTAKHLVREKHGVFPRTYTELLALKGVGPYTAAAIASFAYDLSHPVIDGNVSRVVSRLFAVTEPVDSGKGKKLISGFVNHLIDPDSPSAFNQAIMDFGSAICIPGRPQCNRCPVSSCCEGRKADLEHQLPKKRSAVPKRNRYFYYLKIHKNEHVFIRKRRDNDIWQNLYEFYLLEYDVDVPLNHFLNRVNLNITVRAGSEVFVQDLTHQRIHARFAEVDLIGTGNQLAAEGYIPVNQKKLRTFAFPKVIDCYLRDKALNLNPSF
ncbi:MAG: A/G-specific adenine glycosylase [Saprospiraceae bacterium]|nr:A/G-specific adenine glycosylase [Saprospiraceae bacterium]